MAAGAEQHGAGGGGEGVPLPLPLGELTCPWCGAAVDEDALQCPACTGPLRVDEPVEGEPESDLPPLPDGGLAALMPAWLLDESDVASEAVDGLDGLDGPPAATPTPASLPSGETDALPAGGSGSPSRSPDTLSPRAPVDPEPLLTEADLPAWLLALAARDAAGPGPVVVEDRVAADAATKTRTEPLFLPDARPPAADSDVVAVAAPLRRDDDAAARRGADEVPRAAAVPAPAPARPEAGWVAVAVLLALLLAFAAVAVAAGVWEVPFRR